VALRPDAGVEFALGRMLAACEQGEGFLGLGADLLGRDRRVMKASARPVHSASQAMCARDMVKNRDAC